MEGSRWFRLSGDIALNSGRQTITRSDGVDAHALVTRAFAYVSGNQKALVTFFGFPTSVARKIGARWVRVPSTDPSYATVAAGATLPSALSEVKPSGHLTELPARGPGGHAMIRIRGGMPKGFKGSGTDTILVTRSAHPLLASATFAGSGHTYTTTFSHWGEHIATKAPAHWIANNRL